MSFAVRVMSWRKGWWALAWGLLVVSAHALAGDVFVDPSRSAGCPGSGTADDPYCSWAEVRQFAGGTRYLQKAGTTYLGGLRIAGAESASQGRPVYVGAYGTGPRPRIRVENPLPGGLDPANWKLLGRSVWAFSTAGFAIGNPAVLLLDGRRAFGMALRADDLCARHGSQRVEWYHDGKSLLVCSMRGNPALAFRTISGMQVRSGEPPTPVLVQDQSHVILDGLALEGGRWGALEIQGQSADVVVRNCSIGLDSASGIRAQNQQDTIRGLDIGHNTIDSGVRWGAVGYSVAVSGEGVHFSSGVRRSRVHNNELVAWPHNGVYLDAHAPGSPGVTENVVDGNDIHCGPSSSYYDYCRPLGVDGYGPGAASGNIVLNNVLHDFSVASQINGDNNYFIGNLCYQTVNSGARRDPTGQCFSLQAYQWSRDNLIANNTMADMADVAVQFRKGAAGVSQGHRVMSNILYGCGRDTTAARRGACISMDADPSVGPQSLIGNLLYNPPGGGSLLYRGRDIRDPGMIQATGGDVIQGNMIANPLFRAPGARDFSLLPGSPAIGAGQRYVVPGLRFDGSSPDVGAWQSAGSGSTAGWTVLQ